MSRRNQQVADSTSVGLAFFFFKHFCTNITGDLVDSFQRIYHDGLLGQEDCYRRLSDALIQSRCKVAQVFEAKMQQLDDFLEKSYKQIKVLEERYESGDKSVEVKGKILNLVISSITRTQEIMIEIGKIEVPKKEVYVIEPSEFLPQKLLSPYTN